MECHEEAIYLVWETAGEWGTALFEVHRRGRDGAWHRLYEDHTLTALGQTARGGLYRLRDHAAEGEPREYLITEIDIRGGRLARGPFVLEVPRMESGPAPVAAYTAEELPVDPRAAARADAATTRPVPPER